MAGSQGADPGWSLSCSRAFPPCKNPILSAQAYHHDGPNGRFLSTAYSARKNSSHSTWDLGTLGLL